MTNDHATPEHSPTPDDGVTPLMLTYAELDGRDGCALWMRKHGPGTPLVVVATLSSDEALQLHHGLHEAIAGETDPRVCNDGQWPRVEVGYDEAEQAVTVDVQPSVGAPWIAVAADGVAAYKLSETVLRIIRERDRMRAQIDEEEEYFNR